MGVYTCVVAMYGSEFVTREEAEAFLARNGIHIDDVSDNWRDDGLITFCIDAYSGTRWVIGFKVILGETFEKHQAAWKQHFPDTNIIPGPIHEVMYY